MKRPLLFRGQNEAVWCDRMMAAGWPAPFAAEMSAFLVGALRPTPLWPRFKQVGSDPDHSRLEKQAEDDGFLDKWFEPPEAQK